MCLDEIFIFSLHSFLKGNKADLCPLNELVDFHKIRHEHCATGGRSNLVHLNFLQPVITWRAHNRLIFSFLLVQPKSGGISWGEPVTC
jgi:hypothetical protein